ncbi:MAG: ThiF family adenylyltransferase [Lentisphaerae bacterium]|nr:ThiF family adenylyltransferase [Lentisphaerota bacterium]
MFTITDHPIDAAGLKAAMAHPEAGAYAEFEGWVRNHNEGRAVSALDYEAYAELAAAEGGAILEELRSECEIIDARCVHRVGHLRIGEMAVWVGVTARHREAAFRACRAIIDAVKARVPIWKKEHYADGTAEWVSCVACAKHGREALAGHRSPVPGSCSPAPARPQPNVPHPAEVTEAAFYRRQMALPEVGIAGQEKLRAARVLVVGAGGLGCPALSYLAAAGVGHLTVCDGDLVDATNLHRQVLFNAADVGRNKAEVAAERLRAQNPFITVTALTERCAPEHAREHLKAFDVVLDCTDNFSSKFLIHDACYLERRPLVQASLYQFEGQLQVFRPGSGAGCLRCLWPAVPEDGCVGTCADVGVLGVVAGVLGTLQATEALKVILGMPDVCDSHTLLVDVAALDFRRIARDRHPRCPLCGEAPTICDVTATGPAVLPSTGWSVDARILTAAQLAQFQVVDIRAEGERLGNPEWVQRLPRLDWTDADAFMRLPPDRPYLLCCAHGVRSRALVDHLRRAGHANFFTLIQGIDALAPLMEGMQR